MEAIWAICVPTLTIKSGGMTARAVFPRVITQKHERIRSFTGLIFFIKFILNFYHIIRLKVILYIEEKRY